MLYIVPTPIGNMQDMSYRAVETLRQVDLVLAEDTRTSRKLFDKYGIDTPMRAHHAHNEHKQLNGLLEELKAGRELALISDAGTPGISDPGFLLVRACAEHDIPITVLPGPSALLVALVGSGLPCDRFHFEGFLPHKKGRQTRLHYLATLPYTFALFESPHRLLKCLQQLAEHLGGERQASVCRELTKVHEEIRRGTLTELIDYYQGDGKTKGEIVIVVAGAT